MHHVALMHHNISREKKRGEKCIIAAPVYAVHTTSTEDKTAGHNYLQS